MLAVRCNSVFLFLLGFYGCQLHQRCSFCSAAGRTRCGEFSGHPSGTIGSSNFSVDLLHFGDEVVSLDIPAGAISPSPGVKSTAAHLHNLT